MKNKYQILSEQLDNDRTKDNYWHLAKKALVTSCQEVLGPRKYHHKDWISTESIEKIKDKKKKMAAVNNSRTRTEKANALVEYCKANKLKVGLNIKKTKLQTNITNEDAVRTNG